MIDLYLDRGTMFVLEDDGIVKGECVVTDEGQGVLEIQNLAITQEYQGNGYGKTLIEFVADHYREQYKVLQVGTGDSPLTIPFYKHCGFIQHHILKRLTDTRVKELMKSLCHCENVSQFQALPEFQKAEALAALLHAGGSIRQVSRLTGSSFGIVRKYI